MAASNPSEPEYIDAFCTPVNETGVNLVPGSSSFRTVVSDVTRMLQRFYAENVFYGSSMPDNEKPVMYLDVPDAISLPSGFHPGKYDLSKLFLTRVSGMQRENLGNVALTAVVYAEQNYGSRIVDHDVDYPSAGNHGLKGVPSQVPGSTSLFVWFNTFSPRGLCSGGGQETNDEKLTRRSMERDRFIDYVRNNAFYCQR